MATREIPTFGFGLPLTSTIKMSFRFWMHVCSSTQGSVIYFMCASKVGGIFQTGIMRSFYLSSLNVDVSGVVTLKVILIFRLLMIVTDFYASRWRRILMQRAFVFIISLYQDIGVSLPLDLLLSALIKINNYFYVFSEHGNWQFAVDYL